MYKQVKTIKTNKIMRKLKTILVATIIGLSLMSCDKECKGNGSTIKIDAVDDIYSASGYYTDSFGNLLSGPGIIIDGDVEFSNIDMNEQGVFNAVIFDLSGNAVESVYTVYIDDNYETQLSTTFFQYQIN